MFVPEALDASAGGPQACKPFTLQSSVCVGDMVAIIACSVAGIGWFFWGIHAIHKIMNEPPFPSEDEELLIGEIDNPFRIPSVENGVVQPLTYEERVRIRLALSAPEEPFYRVSAPISTDGYGGQGSVTIPHTLPRAGGQSQRTSPSHSSRHVSPMGGGPDGERYEYGVNDEYITSVSPARETPRRYNRRVSPMQDGPYGERYECGVNEHIGNVSPSPETLHRSNRRGPPMQDGPYDERYEYGVNDEDGSVSPSRARGFPPPGREPAMDLINP